MYIDPSHPRAISLKIRERLVWGVKKGLTSTAGLIAHGRGEAFDYLLNEKTHDFAQKAVEAAAAYLVTAKRPIISVNGNTAVLCGKDFIKLAKILNCKIEVNLFHYSATRVKKIENYLNKINPDVILKSKNSSKIVLPYIASKRKNVLKKGIGQADVVLVPLEDGDRAEALEKLGKTVIAIDLNPLSRTAKTASITIVDNVIRAIPLLITTVIKFQRNFSLKNFASIKKKFQNQQNLKDAIFTIKNLK